MRDISLLPSCAIPVFMTSATIASAAYAIERMGAIKSPIHSDLYTSAHAIFYSGGRITSSVGGDPNAGTFLDSWNLSITRGTWANLCRHKYDDLGVVIPRHAIPSADES